MPDNIKELTKRACELCEKNFSYDELFEILKNGTDDEKQICILKIPSIKTQPDADLLLFHLTNQHGTVREAAAEKINELMKNGCANFFQTDFAREKLLCAINDVNPNICRFIIEILPLMKEALEDAFKKGWLKNSDLKDIVISTMNTGWEMPGPFNAIVEYKNLSAKYEKISAKR